MAIPEVYHDTATVEARLAAGEWADKTLDDYLQEHARARGNKLAIVDRKWRLSFTELERLAHRVACGMYQLGIRPGDVISIQLPNWAEWLILHCAATKVGAVTNSIGAVYRHREVGYILGYAETALLLIPDKYRGFDYAKMVAELWPELPQLKHVFVAGERVPDSMRGFAELLQQPWEEQVERATIEALRPNSNMLATLMFTSGTTADPKGVMHTHNTMVAGTTQYAQTYGHNGDDVIFMASPIGHSTALLVGARLPVQIGATAVWQEHWQPEAAVALIHAEGCSCTLSATPFLHGLMNAANASREKLASLKTFACGGAPIPRELIRQANEEFGLFVSALYGSSEALINSAVYPDAPIERRYGTDGQLIPGVDGRLVDPDNGALLGPDDEGELQVRSPALCAGYYKDSVTTSQVFLNDGWYATGDLCTLDGDGYVSVVGRKKDMIIRGGANISAREIEELLFTHPKIENVACVAMPDPVLSERVCAYVVCTLGEELTFDEMVEFLKAKRVAVWKLPERLEIRAEFPMTPSGKIQKFQLRREIAELLGEVQIVR
jgi:non-ribosomal peptide synthetase component E (peptide arylation enzyme)